MKNQTNRVFIRNLPAAFRLLVLLFPVVLTAQPDSTQPYHVRVNYHAGAMLPEYGFMHYVSNDFTKSVEVNLLYQTSGKNNWEKLYRYPGAGVAFYWTNMGNDSIFGTQYTLYPYFKLNFIDRKKWNLGYQMGVGASYATKKFHMDQNYQNLAIGSHFNIHYHADLLATFRVYKNMSLNTGLTFSHISNANLSEPNVGLNVASIFIGADIGFGQKQKRNTDTVVKYNAQENTAGRSYMWEVMLCGGMKHTRTFESFQYPAFAVQLEWKKRKRYKFAWGLGADFFYDSSVESQLLRKAKPFKPSYAYMSGLHVSQEFIYNRYSFILQEGVYIGLTEKLNGRAIYTRAINRYKFGSHLFVNITMKSHLHILDFPEFGIGYYW